MVATASARRDSEGRATRSQEQVGVEVVDPLGRRVWIKRVPARSVRSAAAEINHQICWHLGYAHGKHSVALANKRLFVTIN
jgi:hypothetical protein